jgi:hypothetical protein
MPDTVRSHVHKTGNFALGLVCMNTTGATRTQTNHIPILSLGRFRARPSVPARAGMRPLRHSFILDVALHGLSIAHSRTRELDRTGQDRTKRQNKTDTQADRQITRRTTHVFLQNQVVSRWG